MSAYWILAAIGGVVQCSPLMNCSYSYLDECAKDLLILRSVNGAFEMPVTAAELEEQCKAQSIAESCVRKRFEHCTDGVVKGVSRLLLDTIRDEMESRCDSTSNDHGSYLKAAPCLNSVSPVFGKCFTEFISYTDASVQVSDKKPLREKIPHACCNFEKFSTCILSATNGSCGPDAQSFIWNIIQNATGDLVEGACSSYKLGSEVCRRSANLTRQLEHQGNYNPLRGGTLTLMGAFAKLIDSLGQRD